jgi:glycerol-3-phosphate acyltransferase PlsX
MAIGMFVLGLLPGVERPAIATRAPEPGGLHRAHRCRANIDPKPRHLFQFAVMGHVTRGTSSRKGQSRVGLLSVGEAEGKGNRRFVKDTFEESSGLVSQLRGQHRGTRHLQRPLRTSWSPTASPATCA